MHQKLFLFTYLCFAYIININGDMPKNCNKIWGTSNKINDIPVYATNIYSCTESFLDNNYHSSNIFSEVEKINTIINSTQINSTQINSTQINSTQINNTLQNNNTYGKDNYSKLILLSTPSPLENPAPSPLENPAPSPLENPAPSPLENPAPSTSPSLINVLVSDTKISEPSSLILEPSSTTFNDSKAKVTLIIVLITLASFLFIIIIIILYYRNKHKKTHPKIDKDKDLEKGTQILDSKKSIEHLKTFRSNWNGGKGKKAHHIKNTVKKQIEKNKTTKLDNLVNKLKKPVTSNKKTEKKTIPKLHHGLKFDNKTHQKHEKNSLNVNKKIESPTVNNNSIGSELL